MNSSHILLYAVEALSLGFLIGYFFGYAVGRRRGSCENDPSCGKKLHMDVTEEKDTHE
jgi:hypothetical protein